MKTLKKIEITPVFVEFIPETLIQNEVYVSKEYEVSVHLCLCGCGNKSVTPFGKPSAWEFIENNGKISLVPSILNTNCPNNYHYILTNNVANVV